MRARAGLSPSALPPSPARHPHPGPRSRAGTGPPPAPRQESTSWHDLARWVLHTFLQPWRWPVRLRPSPATPRLPDAPAPTPIDPGKPQPTSWPIMESRCHRAVPVARPARLKRITMPTRRMGKPPPYVRGDDGGFRNPRPRGRATEEQPGPRVPVGGGGDTTRICMLGPGRGLI